MKNQYKPNNDCAPILEICEVEVFGCDVGCYDENCSKKCGLCKSGSCDIVTGQCDQSGCAIPGLQTPSCKACPSGHYGEKCSETCGNCSQNMTCNHINGTCNGACNTYRQPAYIAAQGPIVSTIEDFWQMVWQEDVYVIAMVTNLSEGGTIKCAKYWPDNTGDKIKIDIFGIQLDSEKTYSSFLIHQLQLTNLKTKASRQITHLQYTSWPDHGTPDPLELLMYHQYVTKAMRKHPENKLLVHCSAGIGRTGTFIALDALYRHGIKEGSINIVEYVHTMREDRMNMIQNLDQYKFLYRALYESLRATIHPFSKEKFLDEVKSVLSSDNTVNLSNLRIQFKELDSLKPVFQENEKSSGFENMTLNMTGSVLPADRIRIILSSHVKGRGTYYNAVPVSTFTMRDCVITGQYPVPGAAVDLIRLLVDQECSTLISTSPLSEVPSEEFMFSCQTVSQFIEQNPDEVNINYNHALVGENIYANA
uniref:Receptor-type tyrosine-protein phosphatase mu n=1 Tax=Magallana gigas TaxID=29159 RepID=K1QP19_MAGGI